MYEVRYSVILYVNVEFFDNYRQERDFVPSNQKPFISTVLYRTNDRRHKTRQSRRRGSCNYQKIPHLRTGISDLIHLRCLDQSVTSPYADLDL